MGSDSGRRVQAVVGRAQRCSCGVKTELVPAGRLAEWTTALGDVLTGGPLVKEHWKYLGSSLRPPRWLLAVVSVVVTAMTAATPLAGKSYGLVLGGLLWTG